MKNQKLVDAFQSGLAEHMEELRGLVVGGVGVQQQQLRALEEQLEAFLKLKDQVLLWTGCGFAAWRFGTG